MTLMKLTNNLVILLEIYKDKRQNKLGLSCAKLRPASASYQLDFVWLALTQAAYYA